MRSLSVAESVQGTTLVAKSPLDKPCPLNPWLRWFEDTWTNLTNELLCGDEQLSITSISCSSSMMKILFVFLSYPVGLSHCLE